MQQKGIAGEIKRDAQKHVTGTLKPAQAEDAVDVCEMPEHVARRQGHLVLLERIPRTAEHSPVVWIVFQDLNNFVDIQF